MGTYEFTSKSEQAWEDGPVFLVDLKEEGGKYTGQAVTESVFAAMLASTGQNVLFFIHGYMVQTKAMLKCTHEMQREFNALVRTGLTVALASPSPSPSPIALIPQP